MEQTPCGWNHNRPLVTLRWTDRDLITEAQEPMQGTQRRRKDGIARLPVFVAPTVREHNRVDLCWTDRDEKPPGVDCQG